MNVLLRPRAAAVAAPAHVDGSEAPPPPPPPPPPATAPAERGQASGSTLRFLAASASRSAAPASPTPSPTDTRALEAAVQKNFDAARGSYVVDGAKVEAMPQFRMNGGNNQDKVKNGLEALKGRLGSGPGKLPLEMVGRVLAGRGSADEVRRVTQALIDAGRLPAKEPGESGEARVQKMMWEHGVGMDCAGFVQQSLAAVHGRSAAQLGLRSRLDEDLGGLDHNPHFAKVAVLAARPGDVITLRDDSPNQPGHTVLVASHQQGDGRSMLWRFNPNDPAAKAFVDAKSLEIFEVDSSWSAGTTGHNGGVKRETWIFNHETGKWGSFFPGTNQLNVDDTPYLNHTLVGAYRPK